MFLVQRIIICLVFAGIQTNAMASQTGIPLNQPESFDELVKELAQKADLLVKELAQKADLFETRLIESNKLLLQKTQAYSELEKLNQTLQRQTWQLNQQVNDLNHKLSLAKTERDSDSSLIDQHFQKAQNFAHDLKESKEEIEKLKTETNIISKLTQENQKYKEDIENLAEKFSNAEVQYTHLDRKHRQYKEENPENNVLLEYLKYIAVSLRTSYEHSEITNNKNWVADMPFGELQRHIQYYLDQLIQSLDFMDQTITANPRYQKDALWYKRLSQLTTAIAAIAVCTSAYLYKNPSVHHV